MDRARVLIVDDQHLFAEGLKHIVEGESQGRIDVVGVAANGEEAVRMTSELSPEVVLMDVRMPVVDGVEATRRIKSLSADVKVMMLTTFDDDELVYDALGAGANGYVLKIIEPRELVLAVDAVHTGALFVSPSVGYRLVDNVRHGDHEADIVGSIARTFPALTVREAEVVAQILRARRNSEIAAALYISEKTVRNHVSAIYEKLGIHNRLQLMTLAVEKGVTLQERDLTDADPTST